MSGDPDQAACSICSIEEGSPTMTTNNASAEPAPRDTVLGACGCGAGCGCGCQSGAPCQCGAVAGGCCGDH
jgi:hypothetical protein